MILTRFLTLCAFMGIFAGFASNLAAQENTLIADVSQDDVAITTTFHGTQLLLFGAVSGQSGDEIVIIISGPEGKIATRRKEKIGGIWVNRDSVIWKNAPSYYQIFSTGTLADAADNETRRALEIGYQNLPLRTEKTNLPKDEVNTLWRDALARTLQGEALWEVHENSVSLQADALFRVTVPLPKNIRPGDYDVRVLHFRDGVLLAENENNISVAKRGIGALIYRFAHEYSIFYGIFAVLFAVASGWLAAVAFRRA